MSKGGGQTQTQTASIPKYIEDASKENLARARHVASLDYMPYMGPTVAALGPLQLQSMQSTGMGMEALGLAPQGFDATAGMPQAQDFGGIQGYSSFPLYEQAVAELARANPAQFGARQAMFINPQTGELGLEFGPQGVTVDASASLPTLSTGSGDTDPSERMRNSTGGSFGGGALPNPILDKLAQNYNNAGMLQRVISPLSTGAGFLAKESLESQGFEFVPELGGYARQVEQGMGPAMSGPNGTALAMDQAARRRDKESDDRRADNLARAQRAADRLGRDLATQGR